MLFNVTYWQPNDNENDGFFKTVKCVLSDLSYKQLFIEKPPDFIELVVNEGDLFKVHPYLQIKNADGTHAMWVPSIGDIFAEDWDIKS